MVRISEGVSRSESGMVGRRQQLRSLEVLVLYAMSINPGPYVGWSSDQFRKITSFFSEEGGKIKGKEIS